MAANSMAIATQSHLFNYLSSKQEYLTRLLVYISAEKHQTTSNSIVSIRYEKLI